MNGIAKLNHHDVPDDFLQRVIEHCEGTTENQWCVGVVRTKDSNANCLFGHIFNMGGSDEIGSIYWNLFESTYANTYMIYPVNDGQNPRYPQDTPRKRCLAYLKALESGEQEDVCTLFENDYKRYLANKAG